MNIGTTIPNIKLKSTNNELIGFYDIYEDVIVIIFTSNNCPYSKAYEARIKSLAEDYKRNVQFLLINSNNAKKNPAESYKAMQEAHRNKEFKFPYLQDEKQEAALELGASCTPHAFVFAKKKLIYQGAIDDNWKEADLAMNFYLKDAIDAGLGGKRPLREEVEAKGSAILWKK